MSALVCGKRSFFEELPTTPPVSKRLRCSSTSPIRFSPTRPTKSSSPPSPSDQSSAAAAVAEALNQLQSIFPDMDKELLERALEESGDLESAIKRLNELRLGSGSAAEKSDLPAQEVSGGNVRSQDLPVSADLPKSGAEWVEVLVSEMSGASNMDEAKARASRVLEVLENSIRTSAGAAAAGDLHKEMAMLKEQMEVFVRENAILKKAVTIQHERQKEFDDRNQELHQLKQLVAQYQEQLRTLEINNYALTMHLRQAQQGNSMPGRFHPDVF